MKKVAPTKVVLGAASDKLPFTLIANIATISDIRCVDFEGEFNPMMAMMIKGLLVNLLRP
jgi:putative sterol carrier protein